MVLPNEQLGLLVLGQQGVVRRQVELGGQARTRRGHARGKDTLLRPTDRVGD